MKRRHSYPVLDLPAILLLSFIYISLSDAYLLPPLRGWRAPSPRKEDEVSEKSEEQRYRRTEGEQAGKNKEQRKKRGTVPHPDT